MTLPDIIEINGIKYKRLVEIEHEATPTPKHDIEDYFFTHDIFNLSFKDYADWSKKYTNLGRRGFKEHLQRICDYYQQNPSMWTKKNLIFKLAQSQLPKGVNSKWKKKPKKQFQSISKLTEPQKKT